MNAGGVAPRRAALEVLGDVAGGAYADRAAAARFARLAARDRGLAQELAFGTIRLRGRLDAELALLSRRSLDRLDPAVLSALRLGLYQLRETRIPPHAAVNATLDAARPGVGSGARGLVNAVLRRAAREGRPDAAFPSIEDDPAGYLAAWGSHPRWLVERWLERLPLATVRRLIELDNEPPPVTFRRLDASLEEPLPEGLAPLAGRERMAVLASGTPADAIREGRVIAQDPAASDVVDYVGSGPVPAPVVDLCAAPGGKTIGLWFATEARPLVAADVNVERLRRVRDLAAHAGAEPWLVAMDGRRPALRGAGTVLLDAPCSGTGVLRRRPDARWRLDEARIASLVRLQRELLTAAADLVAGGGLLVYATCSLEPEENEHQVEWFLGAHPEFERDAGSGGDLHVRPWENDSDGAYASRLRKRRTG